MHLPEDWSADEDSLCSKGEGLDDVSASRDASINVHFNTACYCAADIGEDLSTIVYALEPYKEVMLQNQVGSYMRHEEEMDKGERSTT